MLLKKSFFLLLVFLPVLLYSQDLEIIKTLHKNWRAGASGGMSYLAMELKKDFSQAGMDMNSTPNIAYSLFFNKRFKKHIEIGLELEKNVFTGYKNHSGNVNWLMYSPTFNNENSHFIPNPIYYSTNIWSLFLNMNYSFLNFYSYKNNFLNMNAYLKAGVGLSSIGVEMGYQNKQDYFDSNLLWPLYEKGQGSHPARDWYGTIHAGAGINYFFSERISVSLEAVLLFVSNDYLDGVHNFSATNLPDGTVEIERYTVFGSVGELKIGVSYYFNLYRETVNKSSIWNKKKEEFKNDFYYEKKHNRFK
ncbi:MAG: hypothetical protein JW798_06665 [Prolixibacteraceae bacterium]|nr:hypothetical protein [Prolixibacteraceae bacterium]